VFWDAISDRPAASRSGDCTRPVAVSQHQCCWPKEGVNGTTNSCFCRALPDQRYSVYLLTDSGPLTIMPCPCSLRWSGGNEQDRHVAPATRRSRMRGITRSPSSPVWPTRSSSYGAGDMARQDLSLREQRHRASLWIRRHSSRLDGVMAELVRLCRVCRRGKWPIADRYPDRSL
jgi:hypothetical protein